MLSTKVMVVVQIGLVASLSMACGKSKNKSVGAPVVGATGVANQTVSVKETVKDTAAALVGSWELCQKIPEYSVYEQVTVAFTTDNKWAGIVNLFKDAACSQKMSQEEIDAMSFSITNSIGTYKTGKTLTDGSIEMDWAELGPNRTDYVIYKIEGNKFRMSNRCDEIDLTDSGNDYCYGKKSVVGDSPENRSLELSSWVFTKK